MERLFTIWCLLIGFCIACNGQKVFKQLTTDDGFSEIKCFDIFQDSKGYIWVGTSAGVNKYDGRDVLNFDRSNGLLSAHIYSFYEDSQNRIWINNLNGEPMYVKDDIIHNRYTDPELNKMKGKSYYMGYAEDNSNRIWSIRREGCINIVGPNSVETIIYNENPEIYRNAFQGVQFYNDEIIVVASLNITSLDPMTRDTNWIIPIDNNKSYFRDAIHEDKLYLMNLFEAFVVDLKTKEIKSIKRLDGNPPIYDLRVLYDEVLVSTKKGISIVRDTFLENYHVHETIDSIAVSAVQEDSHGDLWIATKENGVYYYYSGEIEQSKFSDFCNIIYIEEFSKDSTFIVQEDWNITLLVNDSIRWKKQLNKKDENRINNIFYKHGELWVIDKFQIHMDVEGDYKHTRNYSRESFYDEETMEYYWIGTRDLAILDDIDYVCMYDNMNHLIDTKVDSPATYNVKMPYDMDVDDEMNVWVGSESGLYFFNGVKMKKMDIPEIIGGVSNIRLVDDELIGINYGNGLFIYNIQTEKIEFLTSDDGLPTDFFTNLEVKGDDVWVSYARGLCHLRKEDSKLKLIKNLGTEHGIPKGQITTFKIIDGYCHFVVNGHAYSIKQEQETNDTLEILMDVKELSYFTNEARTVNFDCINYTFAERLKYECRLLPNDTTWTETNGEKVVLEYIPAGEYELQIRAVHPLNLFTPIKSKPIIIRNKWYNENYFRALVLLFMGLILYFLIRIKALSFNTENFKHWIANKIEKYFAKEERNSFNIKDVNGVVHLLKIDDINYIKSSGNYLEYYTENKKYVSRMTMSNAVEKFKIWSDIQRVHRSYMVNFNMIEAIDHKVLKVGDHNIPFTDRYRDVIESKLQL